MGELPVSIPDARLDHITYRLVAAEPAPFIKNSI
jgi:hypothetical protein